MESGAIQMVTGQMPFFCVMQISGDDNGKILATDIWSKAEAIAAAKIEGKKAKASVAVYQMKQVFSTDTGEFKIEF
jgi:hypothetical protein